MDVSFSDLLSPKKLVKATLAEGAAFTCLCCYLFFEYVRPQSIYPQIDILPWAQSFLVLSLGFAIIGKSEKFVFTRSHFLMTSFLLAMYFSGMLAYWPETSSYRYNDFLSWYITFFLITIIVSNYNRLILFFILFIVCNLKLSYGLSLVFAKRGFAFTDWGLQGPPGYFTNSGELAIQMLIFLGIGIYLLRMTKLPNESGLKEKIVRAIYISIPITSCLVIVGASSRGSQIAMVMMLFLVSWKKILNFKTLLTAVVCVTLIWKILPDEQVDRFTTMGEDDTSVQRINYWTRGYQMFREHPMTGVGFYNFPQYFEQNYPQDLLFGKSELPHNIVVQVASELGLIGLIPYLAICSLSFFAYRQVKDSQLKLLQQGVSLGAAGFFIAGQFVSVVYYPYLWMAIALTAVILKIDKTKQDEIQSTNELHK